MFGMTNIAFFTEMGFEGRVPRTHTNSRTEFAWMIALNAEHYNINKVPNRRFDLGIVIIPKNVKEFDIQNIKNICNKVAVMQEGPHWFFQDYPLQRQIWYYNTLRQSDIIFTHNEADRVYYEGLVGHSDVRVLPSLMIEDTIKDLPKVKRKGVIIGGNFVSWYGGFDSYIVASEITDTVYSPSMGRNQEGEEQLLKKLPYLEWTDWIKELNRFKIGVHLMRTHAAGTFALNCAFMGIPCIGYAGLDTQEKCHPYLTVDLGDIVSAKEKIHLLNEDEEFYNKCSQYAVQSYNDHFSEKRFKEIVWK